MAAQQSGLSIPEVEALVAEADGMDETTLAYNDEMNRLQGGPRVEYSYGNRPSITSSIQQALADIQRSK